VGDSEREGAFGAKGMKLFMSKTREITAINVDYGCSLKCEACEKYFDCTSSEKENIYQRGRMRRVRENLAGIKYKVAIMSGKGGVGKSSLTAALAMALVLRKCQVSVVDQDFDGPCIPRMLGVMGKPARLGERGIIPALNPQGIKVISTGMLQNVDNELITWMNELRRNATEEFLGHVDYSGTDYLLIDMPPGTSSDCVNVMQCLPELDGAVVVTMPTKVSQEVAKKAILFCRKAGVRVLGVVENMSGYVCPHCSNHVNPLLSGGGEEIANEMGVDFWGRIPIDTRVSECMDRGESFLDKYPDSLAVQSVHHMAVLLQAALDNSLTHGLFFIAILICPFLLTGGYLSLIAG
jgi:ATP-binding protein involved in chromosome partitioning